MALVATDAKATTVQRFTLEQLVATAEHIFVGRCHSTSTQNNDELLYTRYVFTVEEMLKGGTAEQVTFSLQGGKSGRSTYHLVGMPTFVPNEDVVLFLTGPDALGNPWPVGLAQGKFRIEIEEVSGRRMVFRQLPQISLYDAVGSAKKSPKPVPLPGIVAAEDRLPLTVFLDSVRALTTKVHDVR